MRFRKSGWGPAQEAKQRKLIGAGKHEDEGVVTPKPSERKHRLKLVRPPGGIRRPVEKYRLKSSSGPRSAQGALSAVAHKEAAIMVDQKRTESKFHGQDAGVDREWDRRPMMRVGGDPSHQPPRT